MMHAVDTRQHAVRIDEKGIDLFIVIYTS